MIIIRTLCRHVIGVRVWKPNRFQNNVRNMTKKPEAHERNLTKKVYIYNIHLSQSGGQREKSVADKKTGAIVLYCLDVVRMFRFSLKAVFDFFSCEKKAQSTSKNNFVHTNKLKI